MANTNGTLAGALIAQEVLPILQDQYPVLNDIVTNFSDEPVLYGQNVITKIPTIGSSQAYSTTTGYAAASGTLTDVTVNVGTHEYWGFALNDQERSGSPLNLIATYSEAFAAAIGVKLMTDLTALFTESNYTGTPTTQAISGATVSNVVGAANTALNGRKVSQLGRWGIFNSSLAGALRSDPLNVYLTAGGVGITSAQMPNWQGVHPTDYADLPGNSINLIGVVGAKDAICFASRVPEVPTSGDFVGSITNVTDKNTGLTIQVREWYDQTLGQYKVVFTLMYGFAKGNAASAQLIVSA